MTHRISKVGVTARQLGWALGFGTLLGAGAACSGDQLTPGHRVAADSLYWRLELNHRAVTLSLLAPYDTLTVTAIPRNVDGEALPGLGTPQYSSIDQERVQITPEGVLRAVELTTTGADVPVVATLTVDNLKHVDTVLVRVVADTLPKLASFSIHPVPPDSAKQATLLRRPLFVQAIDSTGAPISDPLVAVWSSDLTIAQVLKFAGQNMIAGWQQGQVTLVASTTIFGVAKVDTLSYRIGWPVALAPAVIVKRKALGSGSDSINFFEPVEIRVGVGASVGWRRGEDDTSAMDVTFGDGDLANIISADSTRSTWEAISRHFSPFVPTASAAYHRFCDSFSDCSGAGNIEFAPGSVVAYRVFTRPGTYEYRSLRYGTTGRIIVIDEAQ